VLTCWVGCGWQRGRGKEVVKEEVDFTPVQAIASSKFWLLWYDTHTLAHKHTCMPRPTPTRSPEDHGMRLPCPQLTCFRAPPCAPRSIIFLVAGGSLSTAGLCKAFGTLYKELNSDAFLSMVVALSALFNGGGRLFWGRSVAWLNGSARLSSMQIWASVCA
jgi:hypothetical protein